MTAPTNETHGPADMGHYEARSPVPIISCGLAREFYRRYVDEGRLSLADALLLAFHIPDADLNHEADCPAGLDPKVRATYLQYFVSLVE